MSTFSLNAMKRFLSRSISSLNQNKIRGLMAEIDFRNYIARLGFGSQVSVGGWIARSEGANLFGHNTVVIFPETISPAKSYPLGRRLPTPSQGLHTICATFHQIGIRSYFCPPVIGKQDDPSSIQWQAVELGLPAQQPYAQFPANLSGFNARSRNYNFLMYNTNVSPIPKASVPEEFSKEHIRVAFQNRFMSELSDIDGILWGHQLTYPIEIKEKTAARDNRVGEYFGLDVGPFVKLAFYAAKRGNLHSIFIVREIGDPIRRNLVKWWYITFDQLAQYASWNPVGGGRSMQGTSSTVIKIPKAQFKVLDKQSLGQL